MYVCFAIALVTSPLTFLWFLVLGAAIAAAGLVMKQRTVLATGLGLLIGAVPYPLLGLLQNL